MIGIQFGKLTNEELEIAFDSTGHTDEVSGGQSPFLMKKIAWRKSDEVFFPFSAKVDGRKLLLRLNDFPDEHLYTLIVDGRPLFDIDDWPDSWQEE